MMVKHFIQANKSAFRFLCFRKTRVTSVLGHSPAILALGTHKCNFHFDSSLSKVL